MENSVVIDCDSHVMEPADLWQNYLEPKYRDRAIRIEEVNGMETLIIGEQPVLAGVLAGLGGAHVERTKLFTGGLKYADGCPPASYQPQDRAILLDEWGVDRGVVFPTIGILPFPTKDMDLANAYCRAYNTWQSEFMQSIPDRCIAIALVNFYDIDEAVKELERCIKLGFKGVFVPPEIVDGHRPGQSYFDPLWQRCAEAGIPACLHVIVRFTGAARPFVQWLESGMPPTFTFAMGAPGQIMPALGSMVMDGVLERIPDLKVLCVEAGCGWAPYLMDRLDEKHRFFEAFNNTLTMKPSDYIKRNCYFVAEPDERTIDSALTLVGEDKILWGSDYPHIDSTLEAPNLIREQVATLSPERRAAVMGENAVKLFGV